MPTQGQNAQFLFPIIVPLYELTPARKRPRTLQTANGGKSKSRRKDQPRRILMFGRIFELALYRAEVLRSHGYSVVTPKSKGETVALIEDGEFDALVLSYTLESETAEELVELARQNCPDCKLITISETNTADRKLHPDLVVRANEGPAGLLKALRKTFPIQ
jgi:hypothetical protein